MNIKAIDTHAHFSNEHREPNTVTGQKLIDDIGVLRKSVGCSSTLEKSSLQAEDLLAEMEANNIESAWIHQLSFEKILGYEVLSNQEIAAVLKKYPGKFRGFAGIDPHSGEKGVSAVRYWIEEHGFSGIKFNPNDYGGYFLNDTVLMYPLLEECCRRGVPVSFHTGLTPGSLFRMKHNNPIAVDDIAVDFPELTIILEHMGHPWETAAYDMMGRHPNLYITVTAIANIFIHNNPRLFLAELLKMLGMFGSKRILWGSDWTATPNIREVLSFLRSKRVSPVLKIAGFGDYTTADRYNILYNNAKMLFQ